MKCAGDQARVATALSSIAQQRLDNVTVALKNASAARVLQARLRPMTCARDWRLAQALANFNREQVLRLHRQRAAFLLDAEAALRKADDAEVGGHCL